MRKFAQRWWRFVKERFEPFSHGLMILAFFGANAGLAVAVSGSGGTALELFLSLVVTGLFFFHLRLFDELKDLDTDNQVNRDRPLPRGLIPLREFKQVCTLLICCELLLSVWIGQAAFVACGIAIAYSLLMYKEFYIGSWLKHQMELYAISHTVIAGFIALFIFSAVTGVSPLNVPVLFAFVMLIDWMTFNIFEFARKTFGQEEEREGVESYSNRLKPFGAAASVWVFGVVSLGLLWRLQDELAWTSSLLISAGSVSIAVWLASLLYIGTNSIISAKLYRGISSLYLIAFNVVIIIFALKEGVFIW